MLSPSDSSCPICQTSKPPIKILECGHYFHFKCLDMSKFKKCPTCIKTKNDSSSSSDENEESDLIRNVKRTAHKEWQKIILEYLPEPENNVIRYYAKGVCYPPMNEIFAWAKIAPSQIKVCILGQDPYINKGEACGLSFSVPDGIKVPPSLKNIYKAIEEDIGQEVEFPNNGNLKGWVDQGVLLLNASLTVFEKKSNSHASTWAKFTKMMIKHIASTQKNIVFMLWGNFAQGKKNIIEPYVVSNQHLILLDGHPSPLNTTHKFIGTKCFSTCNQFLQDKGREGINWTKHLP